ncbi:MAG: type II toxin-antitoxin system RelE/ParE family toxin [Lentimicrobiaceae bacterium]|jgi:plasmid stabilization system protein ParE
MALEILWTRLADRKFDKIINYLLNEWNQRVTESFVKKVYDTIDILAEFPELGTIEHKEKGIRGFTIVKQINVFYKVIDNKIIILNFFDNRQAPEKKRF